MTSCFRRQNRAAKGVDNHTHNVLEWCDTLIGRDVTSQWNLTIFVSSIYLETCIQLFWILTWIHNFTLQMISKTSKILFRHHKHESAWNETSDDSFDQSVSENSMWTKVFFSMQLFLCSKKQCLSYPIVECIGKAQKRLWWYHMHEQCLISNVLIQL